MDATERPVGRKLANMAKPMFICVRIAVCANRPTKATLEEFTIMNK